jgi:LPS sulfotransferase NodH
LTDSVISDSMGTSEDVPMLDFNALRQSALIYGSYRVGTHMLKLTLARAAGYVAAPESFARVPDEGLPDYIYSTWLTQDLHRSEHKGTATREELLAYLAWLQLNAAQDSDTPRPLLLDVKYDQAMRFGADAPGARPLIIEWLVEMGLPVIHLIRRDAVAQAMSHMLARKSGVFFAPSTLAPSDPPTVTPTWLDPVEVVHAARAYRLAQMTAHHQLSRPGVRLVTMAYEDMLGAGFVPQLRRCLRRLDRYAELSPHLRPVTQRQNSSLAVANRAEIVDYALIHAPDLVGHIPG